MQVSGAAGPLLSTQNVGLSLDNTAGEAVLGYGWGVCHDPDLLTLEQVIEGEIISTANGGDPMDFHTIQLFDDGWTVGAVVNFFSEESIAPGVYDLYSMDYTLVGPDGIFAEVRVCGSELGVPVVPLSLIITGPIDVTPVTVSGFIELGGTPPYVLHAPLVTAAQGSDLEVAITVDGVQSFDAFSFGLAHDEDAVSLTAISEGAALGGLNAGAGPDFFHVNLSPAGSLDGGTVGCVADFDSPFDQISALPGTEIVLFEYFASPGAQDGTQSALVFTESLGAPVVPIVISVGGFTQHPNLDHGNITLSGNEIPVFIRGDANADGDPNISDALFLALALFAQGPELICDDSGDVDDNGVLGIADVTALLAYLFQGGAAPAAPFPTCNGDATDTDSLTCVTTHAPTCP